jgi:Ser/Thr protein kinase RdoA (MazF antagonist)
VWDANERAVRLYESFGFERIGTTRFAIGAEPMEDALYVLEKTSRDRELRPTMRPQAVADAFGLGRATSLSRPVARGELGEIRRLATDRGTFAVKQQLQHSSADDAEASSAYHRLCWEAGVPTPEPLRTTTGGYTAEVDGVQVRAYAWVELADPDPTLDPAAVGTLVARLHQVRHRWPTSEIDPWFEAPIGRAEWDRALEASRAAGAPHAERLAELLPALLEIEEILTPMRPVQTCHLDLWADNLRRSDGGPFVIDFDNAGPGDPSREVAMVIFEFGRGDAVRQRTLYDAYIAAGGPGRLRDRTDLGLAVAELHHIGHRHLTMWLDAHDPEARARSVSGIDEFLAEPLLLPDVDALLEALAR